MGLLDTLSSLFSGKKSKVQNTAVDTTTQIQNTPQQTSPITNTVATVPQTPIEEPASVKSIDDLLKENENKINTVTNTESSNLVMNTAPQAPVNPAEPAPGIATTHTNNSLHANETNSSTEDSNTIKDISL